MGPERLVTQRQLARELLDELGLATLADRFAMPLLNGPQCPWLSKAEDDLLHRMLTALPEPGGPAVSFRMPIGAAPNTQAQVPTADGMLQFARPPDIDGAAGSISHWLDVLSVPLMMDIPDAFRGEQGGHPSPLDLRAVLQQIGWAIERTAKKYGASPPRTARCIALLLLIDHRQAAFYTKIAVNPERYPIFDHMTLADGHRRWRRLADARIAAREEVAMVSRGVYREATLRLINGVVRNLIRDRRKAS